MHKDTSLMPTRTDLAEMRALGAAVDAHAARTWEASHPGQRFADQPWDVKSDAWHSARLVLTP